LEVVVERPTYDLTVFKLHFGKLTAKVYTKGERVLRIEVIVHNTKALPCGRSLPRFCVIIAQLQAILIRFLNALHCIDVACVADATLEALPTASQVGRTRVGGVDLNKPRMRAVLQAVIARVTIPQGFRASYLATQVQAIMGVSESEYTPRQAAYDLKKLRGKNLVRRIGKSHRYEAVPDGLQTMTALLVLREKVIKPVLAGAGKPRRGPKPKHQSLIDVHYQIIQVEMRKLFQVIGIAA